MFERSPRHRLPAAAAAALTLALTFLGACGRADRPDAAGAQQTQSSGEVGKAAWSPGTLTAVRGVPAEAVRGALVQRLGAAAPNGIQPDQWRHTKGLYKRFGQTPLWLSEDGPDKTRATALLRALVSADQDALRLDAYPLVELARALEAVRGGRPTAEQLADADVLLSSAYVALGEDLLTGQVDPRAVSQDWHIDPEEERIDSALVRSLGESALDRGIDRMRPQDPDYAALRQQLARYRELAKGAGWPAVPAGRSIKPGEAESTARLAALRARLAAEGITAGAAVNATAAQTGVAAANAIGGDSASARRRRGANTAPRAARPGETVYDDALAGAVAEYQARHAIAVDSILGVETVKSMNLPPQYRLGQIAANLERMRWMPRALGTRYILVNVPAFHLQAFENGQQAFDMRVIVGQEYEDKKTPVFSDSMEMVVFRPYWNITDDIAEKETWPKINADPGYMEREHLETYQEAGKTRLRQKPGAANSLGLVKFLFPNSYNIYLHDTPDSTLFNKDVRAFSHGCIRVQDPTRLATWVLGWPQEKVRQQMESGPDNQTVKLPHKLPVYIAYFTAYVQDGQLRFGNDLYDRDSQMVQAMTAGSGQQPEVVQAVEALRRIVAG